MSKLILEKKHPKKDLYLTCYSKRAFYKKEWDEQTVNARGHVRDRDGNLLSCPFKKIFNVGEYEGSMKDDVLRRMLFNPGNIFIEDKWNGHLAILFHDGEEWINTTKGSFTHEFIEKDRELIQMSGFDDRTLEEFPKYWTLIFEIIGDHDPHLLTEKHKDDLGGECAVLLAAKDRGTGQEIPFDGPVLEIMNDCAIEDKRKVKPLGDFKQEFECRYNAPVSYGDLLDLMYHEEGTEGWVIHDTTDDFRCKVKTNWFIKERHKHKFNEERTKNIFLKWLDSEDAFNQIPEELHDAYNSILSEYNEYLTLNFTALFEFAEKTLVKYKTRKDVVSELEKQGIDENEKNIIMAFLGGKDTEPMFRRRFATISNNFSLPDRM